MAQKLDKSMIGAAGEHLVLSRLLSMGLLAAQAPRGVRKVDILVNPLGGGEATLIQVKTRSASGRRGWAMNEKHEGIDDEDLFYCFVNLEPQHPVVHVIPAAVVANVIKSGHQLWLDTPGRNGHVHSQTAMRHLDPSDKNQPENWMAEYLENWEPILTRGV
jgi:hypothetical protein